MRGDSVCTSCFCDVSQAITDVSFDVAEEAVVCPPCLMLGALCAKPFVITLHDLAELLCGCAVSEQAEMWRQRVVILYIATGQTDVCLRAHRVQFTFPAVQGEGAD